MPLDELFESAADAVVAGDAATLWRLLSHKPELARQQSGREHRATLLHYCGANGVEQERQESPANAVEIVRQLLDAGAEVNALANIYGGATTLTLVASSAHPWRAGVQAPIMTELLARGADVNGGGSPLLAALRNGRGEAAEFLAQRGARLDVESAAGTGNIDVLRRLWSEGAEASSLEAERGLLWACEYGRLEAVRYLLSVGVSANGRGGTGQTALHWAAIGGQGEAAKILLESGASLEALNSFDGTPLGQAVWSAWYGEPTVDTYAVIRVLVAAGAQNRASCLRWLDEQEDRPAHLKAKLAGALLSGGDRPRVELGGGEARD